MTISVGTISRSSISRATISALGISGSQLGPELQPNWDMSQGTDGWAGVNTTVDAVDDGGESAVLITATGPGNTRGQLSIAGLTIGKTYRASVKARRGIQGATQVIQIFSWGDVIATPITSTSYIIYSFDVVATDESGVSRVYVNGAAGGAIGDEVYVSQFSIREIL